MTAADTPSEKRGDRGGRRPPRRERAMTSAAVIDPRLRARRTEVKRAEGRRRLRILIGAAVLAGLLAVGWGLSRSALLDVDKVTVAGVDPARARLVLRAAGAVEGTPLLDVDPGGIEQAVAALAWVAEARVWRDWPDTVGIEVAARVPVAVAPAGDGGSVLVDADGYVIGSAPTAAAPPTRRRTKPYGHEIGSAPTPAELPLIAVPFEGEPGGVHVEAGPGLAVVAALPSDLRVWVRAIVALPGGRVGLDLAGGGTAVLGEPARLDDKMASVRSVLFGVDLECVTAIDATMADLTTLVRDPLCLPPAPPQSPPEPTA